MLYIYITDYNLFILKKVFWNCLSLNAFEIYHSNSTYLKNIETFLLLLKKFFLIYNFGKVCWKICEDDRLKLTRNFLLLVEHILWRDVKSSGEQKFLIFISTFCSTLAASKFKRKKIPMYLVIRLLCQYWQNNKSYKKQTNKIYYQNTLRAILKS